MGLISMNLPWNLSKEKKNTKLSKYSIRDATGKTNNYNFLFGGRGTVPLMIVGKVRMKCTHRN
jgi:hypothetical protein